MSTVTVAQKPATMQDIAAKTGYSLTTVANCLKNSNATKQYKASTVESVRSAANSLGYTGRSHWSRGSIPANSVFSSREAETAAMVQLRKAGHTDKEVAHRCGVCAATVVRRIGHQPAELTKASNKLAGQVRSAKAKIKKAYMQKVAVEEYNALAAKLNAHLLEVQKMQTSLNDMQKSAVKASKAMNVPLTRIYSNVIQ